MLGYLQTLLVSCACVLTVTHNICCLETVNTIFEGLTVVILMSQGCYAVSTGKLLRVSKILRLFRNVDTCFQQFAVVELHQINPDERY